MHRPKLKLIIGILSCEAHATRREAIRATWLSRPLPPGVLAFFLVGRPGLPPRVDGDLLYLDCSDTYEGLPYKTCAFIRHCLDHWRFDHLFKCDDDTFVALDRLLAYDVARKDYVGAFTGSRASFNRTWHFGKCADPEAEVPYDGPWVAPYAAGGMGYFLSRAAARVVVAQAAPAQELYEDKMVGDILHTNGLRAFNDPKSFQRTRNPEPPGTTPLVTAHPASEQQMYEFHQKLQGGAINLAGRTG
ncbi:MAG: hypothetical protein AB1491_02565 [Thermodesulfobacteriota bacterium]